jgi:hypothetical protein
MVMLAIPTRCWSSQCDHAVAVLEEHGNHRTVLNYAVVTVK